MQKTTIYLDSKELKALKALATRDSSANVASLIRQAIRSFLKTRLRFGKFTNLKKALKQKSSASSAFGDPVSFQRSLRGEWK